ncbi:UDP-glucose:undecaprenyl-phosphate glucose-1-phosphate transferase [Rubripirellula amarantea]|uniref:UDP-glucose:undecaprenyl-phosphate glucose-1-phosphate transferase n=1 Tax=Rubripirellula amarantea TaxID=2527999 RepID=A0A5C5WVY4_9BACT|nr:undecaprenyl-phosphate galactose phosphotransferase WbaP [Rubripirellula amarantea]TWT54143.1 UDP-glucose:undecaprenyl-phosphate glucose-1-phosphate transferase [Rubripirellula amarantea]
MSQIPVGVVSADVIEHFAPPAKHPLHARESVGWTKDETAIEPSRSSFAGPLPKFPVRSSQQQLLNTVIPLVIIDCLAILLSISIATTLLVAIGVPAHSRMWVQAIAVLIAYVGIGQLLGLFPGTMMSPVLEVRQLVRSSTMAFLLILLSNRLVANLSLGEAIVGLACTAVAAVVLPLARSLGRYHLGRCAWWGERGLIIGSGSRARAIYSYYRRAAGRGFRPIGVIDLQRPQSDEPGNHQAEPTDTFATSHFAATNSDVPLLGTLQDVGQLSVNYDLRWGVVAPANGEEIQMDDVMRCCSRIGNLIVLPSPLLIPSLWSHSKDCAGVLGVHITDHLRRPFARLFKLFADTIIAALALLLLSPLIALFVVLIKKNSPGPAFYGHTRIGRGGRRFKAWKLRTMVVNADRVLDDYLESNPDARHEWIEDQKLKNDPRIIPGIGGFLRKSSLDELPQLWNVLVGEMSLVGPRPIVQSEVARYGDMYSFYLRVTPGITGLWQVSGRNDTSYNQRVHLDCYYVTNWSIWLDAYIALRTVRTLLMREGAY